MKSALVALAVVSAGCGDDDGGSRGDAGVEDRFDLTVSGRPSVRDVITLKIAVSGNGGMRTDTFPVDSLPATIPYRLPSEPVAWSVEIAALTAGDLLVGVGSADIAANATSAEVLLEPSDFVVNTQFAGDQFLTTDYEAVGLQIAVDMAGMFTIAYRDDCGGNASSCDVYVRRFDAIGQPQGAPLVVSSSKTTSASQPAVATGAGGTVVVWDYTQPVGGTRGVACRAISNTGALSAQQELVVTEAADVVAATALASGDFALTWQLFSSPTYVTRGMIVHADCTQSVAPFTISSTAASTGTFGAARPHVASNGGDILFSWITDDNLWIRTASVAGLAGSETKILDATGTHTIEHVRLVTYGTGFAAFVRWAHRTSTEPGKLEMYPISTTGTIGSALLISDQTLSDFASNKAIGAAHLPVTGSAVVTWHTCPGPGQCDVFSRVIDASGTLAPNTVDIATSNASDQINPAVAALPQGFVTAWTDYSGLEPDRSGTSVRARIVYEP